MLGKYSAAFGLYDGNPSAQMTKKSALQYAAFTPALVRKVCASVWHFADEVSWVHCLHVA